MLEIGRVPLTSPRRWLARYDEGVPTMPDYPAVRLDELLRRTALRYPEHTALTFFGHETSYLALDEAVDRLAAGLRRLGLGPGERVALFLPNCPQLVVGFYAAWRAGCVAVPVNPRATGPELARFLSDIIVAAGGLKVYPNEIEDVLSTHPKVRLSAVVGVPVGGPDQRAKAFVVLRDGATADADEILACLGERLAPYKIPKAIEFRADLPLAFTGKVLRRVLAEGDSATGRPLQATREPTCGAQPQGRDQRHLEGTRPDVTISETGLTAGERSGERFGHRDSTGRRE